MTDFESDMSTGGVGLLANGSSRLWDVAIEESLDRDNQWSMEIECPNSYVILHLHDLNVVSRAIAFLDEGLKDLQSHRRLRKSAPSESLLIGKFGQNSVELVWDNEECARCFLVIGPRARSTLRLTLHEDDARMLLEALRQVAEDLRQSVLPKSTNTGATTAKTG